MNAHNIDTPDPARKEEEPAGAERYLFPGENLRIFSPDIQIKKIRFEAYLTSRRFFLIDQNDRKPGITAKEIPIQSIISSYHEESPAQEPVLVPGIPISQVQVAPASAVKKSPEKRGLFNAKKTEYRLMGIIVTDRSRTAVINNRDVEAGGTIDGAKVKTITSETVVLEKKGKEFTLSLY